MLAHVFAVSRVPKLKYQFSNFGFWQLTTCQTIVVRFSKTIWKPNHLSFECHSTIRNWTAFSFWAPTVHIDNYQQNKELFYFYFSGARICSRPIFLVKFTATNAAVVNEIVAIWGCWHLKKVAFETSRLQGLQYRLFYKFVKSLRLELLKILKLLRSDFHRILFTKLLQSIACGNILQNKTLTDRTQIKCSRDSL